MFIVYFIPQLNTLSSSSSMVNAIKPEIKNNSYLAAMLLLLYNAHKITATKVAYFSKIYYHTKFQERTLSGPSVTFTLSPFWYY